MKKILSYLIIMSLFLSILPLQVVAEVGQEAPGNSPQTKAETVTNTDTGPAPTAETGPNKAAAAQLNINNNRERTEILVKYKDQSKRETIKNQIKDKLKIKTLHTEKQFPKKSIDLLEIDRSIEIEKIIQELNNNPDVEYAHPNYKLSIETVPNDSRFGEQWGLSNTGQEIQGVPSRSGVDLNAQNAWDITKGSAATVIGVLDTGIDLNHPELANNIYVNAGEIPDNGIDDDGNGYIDDINGWDFVNNDNTIFDSAELDRHGTGTAGIIAAVSNSEGISGVAPEIKLMPLKFIDGNSGYTSDAIEAIQYAESQGIKIINCSFGGTDNNLALKDAMQNSDILFIVSAGNRGTDITTMPVYPAAFNLPNMLSVAAIDSYGVLAPFSSYGNSIDVAAPGVNILTTTPDNTFGYFSGTSASAALVTGIAALIKSYLPGSTTIQLSDRITNNVVISTSLQGLLATAGRVDAQAALTNVSPPSDSYNGPGAENALLPANTQEGETGTVYTTDQLSQIKEKLHYGASGINPATGNYSFTVNDMTVTSPGFEINISRTYNSKDDRSTLISRGWTFGFEGRIVGTDLVTATLPDGSVQTFTDSGTGYVAEDSRSVLVKNPDNTYTLTTKDQYSYGFNADGWLTWMQDRNGNTVNIQVDGTGKINSITDTVNRQYTVNYNAQGLIDNITDPHNRIVDYEYDTNNRLVRVIDPMGGIMRYYYDSAGFVDRIEDHNLKTVETLTYDHQPGENQHKVYQATDSNGHTVNYDYDVTNRKTTIQDQNGRVWIYWYDTSFRTTTLQDPDVKATLTEYYLVGGENKYGDVKSVTDRNGYKTEFEIDDRGNVTKKINPDTSFKEFAYDSYNNLLRETDELGNFTFYRYDAEGKNLMLKARPLNGTDEYYPGCDETKFAITRYSYYTLTEAQTLFNSNVAWLLKTVTNPEGKVTEYTYDADGNEKTVKDPRNKITTYEYNNIGWHLATITPKGYRTDYTYDLNGLLEKKVTNGGETTRTIYDEVGRKIKEIAPNQYNPVDDDLANHTYSGVYGFRYQYYDSGKLWIVTDPENHITTYTYDVYGNKKSEEKPNGAVYTYDYDIMNRLEKVFFKENSGAAETLLEEFAYTTLVDGKTQVTHTVHLNDTETAVTIKTYDYANRLVSQLNPDGTSTQVDYNANGTVNSLTAKNESTTYNKYDGLNRLVEQWSPLEDSGGSTLYTYYKTEYDKAGNKTADKTGKEKVALFGIPSSYVSKSYTYYDDGRLERVTDAEGRKTEYFYDDDGYISKKEIYTSPAEKITTEYNYNHLGKLAEKKLHVQAGNLFGNDPDSTLDTVLTTSYTFDSNGNIETELTPDGITKTYTYDNMNRQESVSQPGTDEFGNPVTILTSKTYNWEGKPLTVTDALINDTIYEYDQRGNLIKLTDAKQGVTAYYYDRAGRKIAEVSPQNYDAIKTLAEMNRIEYVYDQMGRLKAKMDIYFDTETASWITLYTRTYKYDNSGNVVKELDALGYDSGIGITLDEKIASGYGTEKAYNLANKLGSVLDPVAKDKGLSFSSKFEYNALGLKTAETSAQGVITLYSYDDAGNITTVKVKENPSAPEQLIQQYSYDLASRKLSETDANDNTITYQYNEFNSEKKVILPGDGTIPSNIKTMQYDVMGNLKKQEDSTGKVLLYTYDNQGRLLTQTEQKVDGTEAVTTSKKYDKNGNVRFTIDGNTNQTENTYDELNRIFQTIYTVGSITKITTYGYDANSNQITVTDWKGNTATSIYDPLNRLIEKQDPYTTVQKIKYNKNSVQVQSYDALNKLTTFNYDKNNRLIATIDPEDNITSQTYDDLGNIKTKTDGNTNITTYSYDEFNRLKSVVNAKGETTSYTYDLNGNVLTQTDGKGNITTFEYNAADKPIKKIDHGGTGIATKTETYTYYADGKLHTQTDRNGYITTFDYDIHGRLIQEAIGTHAITYIYDDNGNQLTMTDETGTTVRTYDEANRVTTKTVPDIGQITFAYDIQTGLETGHAAEKSTDPKGNITTKVFDKAGRLKEVTADGKTTTYNYYANGSRQNVIYHDGSREDYSYFNNGQLQTLVNKRPDGTTIESYSYTYDGAGNQLSKIDARGTTNYTYDELNRLETVTEPGGRISSYAYDAAGNRQTETASTAPEPPAVNYPAEGTTNEYDVWNQLVKTTTGTQTTEYEYNGDGLRVARTVGGQTTRYLYESDRVVLELDELGNQKARNVYGNNLLMRTAASQTLYYMYNGHADVTALIDAATGTTAGTYYYDAFGNIQEQTGGVNNNITYAGYQWDQEAELYYLNARYYDPKIARFLQEDIYRGNRFDPLSLNLYTYAVNNPIRYFDPSGLAPVNADVNGVTIGNADVENGTMTGNLRDVVAAVGGTVEYNDKTGIATVTVGGKTVEYDVNNAEVKDGRIQVGVRDFLEDVAEVTVGWSRDEDGTNNVETTPKPANTGQPATGVGDKQYNTEDDNPKNPPKPTNQVPKQPVNNPTKVSPPAPSLGTGNAGDKSSIGSISEFKKKYGEIINQLAKELGVDPDLLAAIILVESGGSGFVNGKLKIRFENHYFLDRTKGYIDLFTYDWRSHIFRTNIDGAWRTVHTGKQSDEYAAFDFAKSLNEEAAYMSISMGLGQIMGANYAASGYSSAKEMYEDFSKGHEQQIKGMATFFKNYNNGRTLKAIQNGDLRSFVTQYNGDGQVSTYTNLILKRKEDYKNAK